METLKNFDKMIKPATGYEIKDNYKGDASHLVNWNNETRIAIRNTHHISVDGGWSMFKDWSACPVPCGGGEQTRTRTCTDPAPAHGGAICTGDSTETQDCNTDKCTGKSNKDG